MNITVLGLGQFGYALLRHLDQTGKVPGTLTGWDIRQDIVDEITTSRCHPHVGDVGCLSSKVQLAHDLSTACREADVVFLAIASTGMESVLEKIAPIVSESVFLINCVKSLDTSGTFYFETVERLFDGFQGHYGVMFGASKAQDVLAGDFVTLSLASESMQELDQVAGILQTNRFRVKTSLDVASVELAGVSKNILTLLYGYLEGIGASETQKATIFAKARMQLEREKPSLAHEALFPVWRVDVTMSCHNQTRNKTFGMLLGRGYTPEEAMTELATKTLEGFHTLYVMMHNPILAEVEIFRLLRQVVIEHQISAEEFLEHSLLSDEE